MAGKFDNNEQALEKLEQHIADLAEPKGVPVSDTERQTPGAPFRKVLKAFTDHPDQAALFILDNVDDARLLSPSLLAKAIPHGPDFDVIITTRLPMTVLNRLGWVNVDFLETEDGVSLLDSFVPIPDSPQDAEWKAAYQIAERLGGHAQALTVLAVYMRWSGEPSYVKLLEYLEREGLSLVSQLGTELDEHQVGLDSQYAERVVQRLLEPTLVHLETVHPAAYRAFQLAAFCPPDHVPLPWLVEILEEENSDWGNDRLGGSAAKRAVQMLVDYRLLVPVRTQRAGLVSEMVEDRTTLAKLARIHRVYVDIWQRQTLPEQARAIDQTLVAAATARAAFVSRNWGGKELVWEVAPLLAFAERIQQREEYSVVIFLDQVCQPLRHVGRMSDVKRLLDRFCEIMQTIASRYPENADYASDLSVSYNKMGDLFRALGDGKEARRYYEQALEVSERLARSAPENADYARDLSVSYERMGDLFRALGDGKEARRYYEQALEVRERLARSAPENADYARDLWVSYWRMANLREAEVDPQSARQWWQRAYDVLASMKQRGLHISPEDLGFLQQLEKKWK